MRIRLAALTCISLATVCAVAGCDGDDDIATNASSGSAGRTTGGSSGAAHAGGIGAGGGSAAHAGSSANPGGAGGDVSTAAGAGGFDAAGQTAVGGAAGAGGAEPANLTVDAAAQTLLDTSGDVPTTLYFFGRDIPASSATSAVSACAGACNDDWPVFHQATIVAGPGLKTEDFAELVRPDGKHQTTFKGWPLYSHSADTAPGQRSGDGLGKLWHAVEQPFYSLVVMQGQLAGADTGLYLADAAGHTIYRFLDDQAGSAASDPVSGCTTNGCRKAWPVVAPTLVKSVSSIGGAFKAFIRPDSGEVQLAYAGLPIYYYAPDTAPGDLKGVGKPSWLLAAP